MSDISITRHLPIHKNFVKIPGGEGFQSTRLTAKDVVDLIPGARVVRLGPSGTYQSLSLQAAPVGTIFDLTRWDYFIELPSHTTDTKDAEDYFQILRDAAEALGP